MNINPLTRLGIIVEDSVDPIDPEALEPGTDDTSDIEQISAQNENEFPDADYDLQNEIIKFFLNNPAPEPELFREFSIATGIDADELQYQANILLTQLVNIYTADAENLGYGNPWINDDLNAEMIGSEEDIKKLLNNQQSDIEY